MTLPIDAVLPDLIAALRTEKRAVLQAPPGAGKTTRVPLAILDAGLTDRRIIMLEPRRLAARTAAQRMAESRDEKVGETIGYRIRGENKTRSDSRIEVVTEGILTRMIQSDPDLSGIGCIIFDEFHERSIHADLGLALALEIATLREDLNLVVMSATLDAEPVAKLMENTPLITSEGQAFPVETQWLDRPIPKGTWFETALSNLVKKAYEETTGGMLVFLPGEGEIRRVSTALDNLDATILPLYGALPFKDQQAVFQPTKRRKIVLATAIAETSLTLPDIRVVIDGGKARRARFDPGSGMSRLVTERVTRAEADQRRGRAGRVSEGICYRLWTKGEEGAFAAFPPPEIASADLAPLALELAEWGSDELPFLTAPPEGALSEARELLTSLGALDKGRITPHGKKIARLPLHPRLAHMMQKAGKTSAPLAALLSDRDPMQGSGADLTLRLKAIENKDKRFTRIRDEAKRLAKLVNHDTLQDPAEHAALAYPDRIAYRRPGDMPRWLLSGGKGAKLPPEDTLAGQRMMVVTDTDGHPTEALIRAALPISEASVRHIHQALITTEKSAEWSKREKRVEARIEERLGAIVLSSRLWKDAPAEVLANAMLEGVRQLGLSFSPAAYRFRARVALMRARNNKFPDLSDESLLSNLEDWLLPHLDGIKSASDWKGYDLLPALQGHLDWEESQLLNREVPAYFETPLGRRTDIDYSGDDPEIRLRLQEMFGVTKHPTVAGRPLRVTLLSPANRPVQTTMDLPGFWASSYADVRKDMRSRYPKHPWPEDPTMADPTLRAKRRS